MYSLTRLIISANFVYKTYLIQSMKKTGQTIDGWNTFFYLAPLCLSSTTFTSSAFSVGRNTLMIIWRRLVGVNCNCNPLSLVALEISKTTIIVVPINLSQQLWRHRDNHMDVARGFCESEVSSFEMFSFLINWFVCWLFSTQIKHNGTLTCFC